MAESEGCFVTNTNTPALLGFIDVFIQIFLNRIQKPYTINSIHVNQEHAKDNRTQKP